MLWGGSSLYNVDHYLATPQAAEEKYLCAILFTQIISICQGKRPVKLINYVLQLLYESNFYDTGIAIFMHGNFSSPIGHPAVVSNRITARLLENCRAMMSKIIINRSDIF